MSKTTKIIAALGVVAGLGVAALPAFTYAASTDGAVQLSVEIQDAIAMSIISNGDTAGEGYYNESTTGYAASEGVDTTNYTLYTKNSETPAEFTNHSSATTTILPNVIDTTTMTSTIKVYTNESAGYTLVVEDEDNDNRLVSGTDYISPLATGASFVQGTGAWGISGGDLNSFVAVPVKDSAITVKANGVGQASGGDTTNITYGVSSSDTQATGTYTDVIVYTATSK